MDKVEMHRKEVNRKVASLTVATDPVCEKPKYFEDLNEYMEFKQRANEAGVPRDGNMSQHQWYQNGGSPHGSTERSREHNNRNTNDPNGAWRRLEVQELFTAGRGPLANNMQGSPHASSSPHFQPQTILLAQDGVSGPIYPAPAYAIQGGANVATTTDPTYYAMSNVMSAGGQGTVMIPMGPSVQPQIIYQVVPVAVTHNPSDYSYPYVMAQQHVTPPPLAVNVAPPPPSPAAGTPTHGPPQSPYYTSSPSGSSLPPRPPHPHSSAMRNSSRGGGGPPLSPSFPPTPSSQSHDFPDKPLNLGHAYSDVSPVLSPISFEHHHFAHSQQHHVESQDEPRSGAGTPRGFAERDVTPMSPSCAGRDRDSRDRPPIPPRPNRKGSGPYPDHPHQVPQRRERYAAERGRSAPTSPVRDRLSLNEESAQPNLRRASSGMQPIPMRFNSPQPPAAGHTARRADGSYVSSSAPNSPRVRPAAPQANQVSLPPKQGSTRRSSAGDNPPLSTSAPNSPRVRPAAVPPAQPAPPPKQQHASAPKMRRTNSEPKLAAGSSSIMSLVAPEQDILRDILKNEKDAMGRRARAIDFLFGGDADDDDLAMSTAASRTAHGQQQQLSSGKLGRPSSAVFPRKMSGD